MSEKSKALLAGTAVGRRLIALLTIWNSGAADRLSTYIAENYTTEALAKYPLAQRLEWHLALREQTGRVRVEQIMASEDHAVILVLKAEQGGVFYYCDMRVTDEYPHKIRVFNLRQLHGTDIDVKPFAEEL